MLLKVGRYAEASTIFRGLLEQPLTPGDRSSVMLGLGCIANAQQAGDAPEAKLHAAVASSGSPPTGRSRPLPRCPGSPARPGGRGGPATGPAPTRCSPASSASSRCPTCWSSCGAHGARGSWCAARRPGWARSASAMAGSPAPITGHAGRRPAPPPRQEGLTARAERPRDEGRGRSARPPGRRAARPGGAGGCHRRAGGAGAAE